METQSSRAQGSPIPAADPDKPAPKSLLPGILGCSEASEALLTSSSSHLESSATSLSSSLPLLAFFPEAGLSSCKDPA